MVDYPTNINYIDAATFEVEFEDVAVPPSEMEGGYQISRPRFTRSARRTFRWRYVEMHDADKSALISFWNQMKGRSNIFRWQHPISSEYINCRFGAMTMNFKRIGFASNNIWETGTIEIVEV